MIRQPATDKRTLHTLRHDADLVVVGGGLAGVCCAITAARAGIRVILVQDRPVLGGNASSEVRLWILGATSHMGNNNRWAREGGLVNELLLENLYRNPEGNPLIFDTILLEKVTQESNITLLLNTAVHDVEKDGEAIRLVRGFCSQNGTAYELAAPLFCDASGDGTVAFLAGAAFRMGAESRDEFGEKFAPSAEYGELLGHSLYFYTKDTGKPVQFVPPAYALQDITQIPRYKRFNAHDQGCQLWWIEYGGRLDTVHDTETIKWELWKVVYGVWHYIKNSGQFPEAKNLTLEWVGQIPGKRESRRFEGDYLLTQQDIVEQRTHADAVAFGGWSIDLHPADGIFSEKPGCNQWHSKGIYQIPYRCTYSQNVPNLFLAGRIISATHVAFGSSRVMATGAHVAQAVGMAAALCKTQNLLPRDLLQPEHMAQLQQNLLKTGQHIPGLSLHDSADLVQQARISTSSEWVLNELPPDGQLLPLTHSMAQLIPLPAGPMPTVRVLVAAERTTMLQVELRRSSNPDNHTPDVLLETQTVVVERGTQTLDLAFDSTVSEPQYVFLTFLQNPAIRLQYSRVRATGLLSVFNKTNPAVSNYGKQEPTGDIGVDTFEFWCPERRPGGQNLAMTLTPGVAVFGAENLRNGLQRPTRQPNAWVANLHDPNPTLTLEWDSAQLIQRIELFFDADYDHPLETVLMHHPETVMPFCVPDVTILDHSGSAIYTLRDNHQAHRTVWLETPIETNRLAIRLQTRYTNVPASLMEVRCYSA